MEEGLNATTKKVSHHNRSGIGVQVTLLHYRTQGMLQGCPRVGEI